MILVTEYLQDTEDNMLIQQDVLVNFYQAQFIRPQDNREST